MEIQLAETGDPRPSSPIGAARGQIYLETLRRMHAHLAPEWYLEIGTATGRSLRVAPGRAIAVDPGFAIRFDPVGSRPELHAYRMTSDEFFASGAARRIAPKIDLAFLDGLHLFEFLLRDFMNVERLCRPDSVIAMHDVIPLSHAAANRDWDRAVTQQWTGDVWKVVDILRRYRPDLTLVVADCRPSGLALVTGLDPASRVLDEAYEEIVHAYLGLTLPDFGEERLARTLSVVSAEGPETAHFAGLVS